MKIARAQAKLDQIPENTKDPGLLQARKKLKKKMPKRREGVQYWNESQFHQLVSSPPANLASRGRLPWRLLAYMLDLSPEVEPIRQLVDKRLLSGKSADRAQKELNDQLITLWRAGYVELDPKPSLSEMETGQAAATPPPATAAAENQPDTAAGGLTLDLGQRRREQPPLKTGGDRAGKIRRAPGGSQTVVQAGICSPH